MREHERWLNDRLRIDVKRIDKSLFTNNPRGIPISLISTRNEDEQAEFVAKEIKKVIKYSKGLVTYKDFAVLMRMNYISQKFEATFRKQRIPFTIVSIFCLFVHAHTSRG